MNRQNKHWTPEETDLLKKLFVTARRFGRDDRETVEEIAYGLGRSSQSIETKALREGLITRDYYTRKYGRYRAI